jgi:membrane protein required for colicin V production
MLIDILFIVLMVVAVFKGYSRGIIIAVFSLLAIVLGLAAAIKLSLVTAQWLKDAVQVGAKWLPVLAFALVFIVVVLLVRLGATLLEKTAETVMLGWINRIAGVLLYMVLYTIMLSVLLFYAAKLRVLGPDTFAYSKTYAFIEPWGPVAIDTIGRLVPVFKDMFAQLESFFAGVSDKMRPN